MSESVLEKSKKARIASLNLAKATSEQKNASLDLIGNIIDENRETILSENKKDLVEAEKSGLEPSLLARLKLDDTKIDSIIASLQSVSSLEDPTGKTLSCTLLDDGLDLFKVSVPIGVLGVVFESRPDVVTQVGGLCLKSGNAVLMKGGKEAMYSNRILSDLMRKGLEESGLPIDAIQLIETRDEVADLLKMDDYVNLIIPRGSNEFVKYVQDNTNIPVLGHADGICHMYIHEKADLEMANSLVVDSKTQYPAVCNAIETLLVDESIANEFLPLVKNNLEEKNVELRGDPKTLQIIDIKPVSIDDWATEYNDLILSIKVVSGITEAINHINTYGSGHTDAIVSNDKDAANLFMKSIDSSTVMHNASTRFADGFRYGLGAEVGISTNKIHARGPVGLEGLVTYNFRLEGTGQIVADYAGEQPKSFIHKKSDKKWN